MTRVSDNSGKFALNFAISNAKKRLEDLQIKGSSLKRVTKPSDDPVANLQILSLSNRMSTSDQFLRNSDYAKSYVEYTENAIEELTDIMAKTKELAIAQSSDLYNDEVRKNVAKEVSQLNKQALAIANRRLGSKYIFGGYSTLSRPFNDEGKYNGDTGRISLEVTKDFYVPINLHGAEVFFSDEKVKDQRLTPLAPFPEIRVKENLDEKPQEIDGKIMGGRDLASVDPDSTKASFRGEDLRQDDQPLQKDNIFTILATLTSALENADSESVRDLLTRIDSSMDRLITMRTRLGAIHNSISNAQLNGEKSQVADATQKSQLADADVAELYTELIKQKSVLEATYKSGQNILNKNLLDFIR